MHDPTDLLPEGLVPGDLSISRRDLLIAGAASVAVTGATADADAAAAKRGKASTKDTVSSMMTVTLRVNGQPR